MRNEGWAAVPGIFKYMHYFAGRQTLCGLECGARRKWQTKRTKAQKCSHCAWKLAEGTLET